MKSFAKICIILMFGSMLAACSMTAGGVGEKTHFSFPNSNVSPLGPVKVEKVKWSWIFPRNFSAQEMKDMLNEALAQQAGADLVINYKTDVTVTVVPILNIIKTTFVLQGTAADMVVGEQALLEKAKY